MNQTMNALPYIASLAALAVSLLTFLWTFYKDTAYRSKVRVSLTIAQIHGPVLDVVNFGPGSVTLDFLILDSRPWFERVTSRLNHKSIAFPTSPIGKKLEAGETYRHFMGDQPLVLGSGMKIVGICDMMRRAHYVPYRQVRAVVRERRNSPEWKPLFDGTIKPPLGRSRKIKDESSNT